MINGGSQVATTLVAAGGQAAFVGPKSIARPKVKNL